MVSTQSQPDSIENTTDDKQTSVVLVTGATGTVGSEIVKQLSEEKILVYAACHGSDKIFKISKYPGVKIISGFDYEKPETYDKLFEADNNKNSIYRCFFLPPQTQNSEELTQMFADKIKEESKQKIKRIVKLSAMGTAEESSFTTGRMHYRTEKILEDTGIKSAFLHPNFFMQNFVNFFGDSIRKQSAFYIPGGDAKVSFVDVRDVAAIAVKILAEKNEEYYDLIYNRRRLTITGSEAISYYQAAEILSGVTGKRISYVDLTEEDAKKAMKQLGMPDWIINALLELYGASRTGYFSTKYPTVEEIMGRKPISFKQFAEDNVSAFPS